MKSHNTCTYMLVRKEHIVGRKDIDLNEHERLSNINLEHKLTRLLLFYISVTVFNNEHKSYPNMRVKRFLTCS